MKQLSIIPTGVVVIWQTTKPTSLTQGRKHQVTGPFPRDSESQARNQLLQMDARGDKRRYSHSPSSSSFKELICKADYPMSWKAPAPPLRKGALWQPAVLGCREAWGRTHFARTAWPLCSCPQQAAWADSSGHGKGRGQLRHTFPGRCPCFPPTQKCKEPWWRIYLWALGKET